MAGDLNSENSPKTKEQTRVYLNLKESIASGRFSPGEKLAVEELARLFNTSRSTIVLALSGLERDGVVESQDYKGYKIKKLTLKEALHIINVREVLEGYVGRLAGKNITSEELTELEKCIKEMNKYCADHEYLKYSKTNAKFHSIIYDACRNEVLRDVILGLKTQMVRFQYRTSLIPGRIEQSLKEHLAIFEALSKKDTKQAEEALSKHVKNVGIAISTHFELIEISI